MKAKNILWIFADTGLLLLIPLIGMLVSDEVDWNAADFAAAAILLSGTGLLYEFVSSRLQTRKQRIVAAIILFFLLAAVWAELAVGIFGSPVAGS